MSKTHTVEFIASGRGKALCAPDPKYPKGIALDISEGATAICVVDLPYPASECGHFAVRCQFCKFGVGVTAAGRSDDPISVTIPCRIPATMQ